MTARSQTPPILFSARALPSDIPASNGWKILHYFAAHPMLNAAVSSTIGQLQGWLRPGTKPREGLA
jgi:hypothetical protein